MPMRFAPARGASVLLSSSSRGPTGAAATIEVASTSTLAAGNSATVTNAGSSSAASFQFGIPRGADAGIKWLYDSTTSMADPGSGDIRFNNATLSSVTAIAVSATGSGSDVSDWVATWDDSTSTPPAYIQIREEAGATVAIFSLSAVTDNTDWLQLTVAYISGSLSLSAADPLYVVPFLKGTAGTGDFSSNTSTSVDSEIVLFSGTGGKTGKRATGNGLVAANSGVYTGPRTITGTSNQITVTNGDGVAGNPTLSLPADVIIPTVITAPNTGLHILDTNASHDLIIAPGSDLSADHTLTVTTGDADRTLTISGNTTVSQDYSTSGNPQFNSIELGHASANTLTASGGVLSVEGVAQLSTATGIAQGTHTIWIPAQAFFARTTNGAGAESRELTTNDDVMVKGWAFDQTTEEAIQCYVAFPDSWNEGTITAIPYWTTDEGASSETCVFGIRGLALSNDDPMDSTEFGTEVNSSDTWIADNDVHVGPETAAITIGGSPAAGDLCILQVARKVASDDLSGDAHFLGLKVKYTVNSSTD